MKPFEIASQTYAYQGYFDLRTDLLQKKDGSQHPYTFLMTKVDAVSVIAKTEDDYYILTHEYRHAIGKRVLGCPGGRIEKEEIPENAAKRELLEETGYDCKELISLGSYYPLPGVCDQKIFLFFAPLAIKSEKGHLDAFEEIDVLLHKEEKVTQLLLQEEDVDGILTVLFLNKILYEKRV